MIRKQTRKLRIQTKRKLRKLTKLFDQEPKQIGLPPGTLVYTGDKEKEPVNISLFEYDQNSVSEKKVEDLREILLSKENNKVSWVIVEGVHDIELMEKIQNYFNIHPLAMEDIVHTTQRPKAEEYQDKLFIVLRMFIYDEENHSLKNEQVSLILGKNYLLTFLEDPGDVFNPVRDRIRKDGTKIRSNGSDFLAYALIDSIVDSYFHILEKVGEEIEELEDRLVYQPTKEDLQEVHNLRRNMILLRKSVWPLREVISHLQRNEHEIINQSTQIFLRDVYDHIIQIIDTIESYRDMIVGMLDVYLSSTSNKLNEVMKVLTIISTLFIPLTFLAGVYGMNFHYFPELEMKWMYPWGFWIVSILISFVMILFFKRKKWF